jgi:SAM-dependent methyltransferase
MNHQEAAKGRLKVPCRALSRALLTRLRGALDDHALTAADTWERHVIVADLVGRPRDLVDVGGLRGQLARFLPDTRVVAANVTEPADVVVPFDHLPFEDEAFEAATSLDVLEHIAPNDRRRFVAEFLRVTRGRGVLCCPLGTPAHAAAEADIHAWFRSIVGTDHPWLVEHESNGLPTLDELSEAFADHDGPVHFRFHGDFRVVNAQFRHIVLARHRRSVRDLAAYARFRLPYRPDTQLREEPGLYANRVFVLADASARS